MGQDLNTLTIEDPNTWFNVKKFNIGGVNFERPEKVLDLKVVDQEHFSKAKKAFPFKLCEGNRIVTESELKEGFYTQRDPSKIDAFFFKKDYASEVNRVLNFTFSFNPMADSVNKDMIRSFFNHYHSYSNFILTVPSAKLRRNEYVKEKGRKSTRKIIHDVTSMGDYLSFVDMAVQSLGEKNGKPIFVPIPMSANGDEIKSLVEHYMRKEYYSFWFDFEGDPIFSRTLGTLRDFYSQIKLKGYYDKIVSYFTNVKREIRPHPEVGDSASSDVLAMIAGANILGVNFKKKMVFERPKGTAQPKLPLNSNARILSPDSYYYYMANSILLLKKPAYTTQNSIILAMEFENQTNCFFDKSELTLAKMIPTKRMITDFDKGILLKLLSKNPDKSLGDKDITARVKQRKKDRHSSKEKKELSDYW